MIGIKCKGKTFVKVTKWTLNIPISLYIMHVQHLLFSWSEYKLWWLIFQPVRRLSKGSILICTPNCCLDHVISAKPTIMIIPKCHTFFTDTPSLQHKRWSRFWPSQLEQLWWYWCTCTCFVCVQGMFVLYACRGKGRGGCFSFSSFCCFLAI